MRLVHWAGVELVVWFLVQLRLLLIILFNVVAIAFGFWFLLWYLNL